MACLTAHIVPGESLADGFVGWFFLFFVFCCVSHRISQHFRNTNTLFMFSESSQLHNSVSIWILHPLHSGIPVTVWLTMQMHWQYWVCVFLVFNSRMSAFSASQLLALQRKWSPFGCESRATGFQVTVNRATPYFVCFWDYRWWYATMAREPADDGDEGRGDVRQRGNLLTSCDQLANHDRLPCPYFIKLFW